MMTKLCLDCGKPCKPCAKRCIPCGNRRSMYHSVAEREPEKGIDKVCVECQLPFKARSDNTKVCSVRCLSAKKTRDANEKWQQRDLMPQKTKYRSDGSKVPVRIDKKRHQE